ncbi:hypothetical protein ACFE04_011839 [Oxalis oulophora]
MMPTIKETVYKAVNNLPPQTSPTPKMKKAYALQGSSKPANLEADFWFDDACILDMDYFVKTLAGIKAKGVRPDLIGSIIVHYASKWLPDLITDENTNNGITNSEKSIVNAENSSSSANLTASWMKKRFFVETLIGILPPEKDSVPCNFLLRLLRIASMVNVEMSYRAELEKRISWQFDQASLKEVMIPSFSHTCGTLLDVELVIRLVKRFLSLENVFERSTGAAAIVKVAKLVDSYLAEAAVDANLGLDRFIELASALPSHVRASDDGLYRAIDTYLKAHPKVSKQERKSLCRLIDSQKLSPEASFHAAQNERLPVRSVIQVLFSEQNKLTRRPYQHHHLDWSGSFNGSTTRSPTGRSQSKRDTNAHQMEINKLKEEVIKLQKQCATLQMQMEKVLEKKKGGIFKWKVSRFGFMPSFNMSSTSVSVAEKVVHRDEVSSEIERSGRLTPVDIKTKLVKRKTPPRWRNSTS